MPQLFEGNQATGTVKPELAQRWGMTSKASVIAGGGDNAVGAIGVGIWRKVRLCFLWEHPGYIL